MGIEVEEVVDGLWIVPWLAMGLNLEVDGYGIIDIDMAVYLK